MPTTSAKARILVVEDDAPIRAALDVALRGEDYEVQAEPDGTSIQKVVERFRPDLAILDVRLPVGPDGYMIARRLRDMSDLPIVFLTAADNHEDRRCGFKAGADDYLVKPFSMEELLWRIRALLRRSGRLVTKVRQIGDLVIDDDAHTVIRGTTRLDLTRIEYRLLWVLAQHPGQVLSKTQLLNHVWHLDAYDTNLVEVHMSSLRRKLEAHGGRIIHTVRGMGYVLRP